VPLVLVDLLSYTGSKGGMETYTRELYRAIGRAPGEFTFTGFASREGYRLDHSWFPGEVIDSRISGEHRIHWAWGELTQVSRAADRLGAALIHGPATLGPRRSRVPTVLTMHDMLYFSHPEYMSTPLYTAPVKWMEKVAARNASRVLTDSHASAEEIVKYLRHPSDRLQVVHLAGTTTVRQGVEERPRRSDLILAMGNRRPHKNFDGLIRALALIPESERPSLVITGSRGDDPLRADVERLGLEHWVDLRSWVSEDELESLLDSTSALAVPSFAEGFGLPIIDAMARGIPVIISDLPVFREIAADAAVYFDPANDRDIARAIREIISDSALRQRLAGEGLLRAAVFTWERTASETLDGFRAALSAPRRRPS
jgi:glycosyltransferase involved in cell wall biosynthesis